MSEPVKHAVYKLLSERTGEAVAWACEQCKVVVCNNEADAQAHELIEVCPQCGGSNGARFGSTRTYRYRCERCQSAALDADRARRESAFLETAEKVPMAEWKGECLTDGDEGFWWCLEDALDHYDSQDVPRPAYLHECEPETMRLRADHIIENATDEFHEDAAGGISTADEAALQHYLDMWSAKVNIVTWKDGRRRVVLIDQRPAAAEVSS